jgi:hypothetical protein
LAKKYLTLQQREQLQQQIIGRRALEEDAATQAVQDKQIVDFIVEKIQQEDLRAEEEKRSRQATTRRVALEQEEEKRKRVENERKREKDEELHIRRHYEEVQRREEEAVRLRAEQRKEAERIFRQIVRETERQRNDDEEFQQLRDMLWEEEAEVQMRKQEQQRKDRQQQMRTDMMRHNAESIRLKEEVRKQRAEEEARLVQAMMVKFKRDEEQEREEEIKRLNRKTTYKQQIAQQRCEHTAYQLKHGSPPLCVNIKGRASQPVRAGTQC